VANEDKSARYHRLRRRASLFDTASQVILLLGLLWSGASIAIRAAVESTFDERLGPVVVVYVFLIALVSELIHLPFAFYRGVILERRYGLSRETTARWLGDHAKAAMIMLAVLTFAGVIVAWLLRLSPDRWWLFASLVFIVALVLLARFTPVILLPLFYDIRALERDALRHRLLALADRAGAPALGGAYEWRLGDRTTKANAALVGIGRTRRILVSDTLLAGHSDEEIEAVFAHELAHHVYGDIWTALMLEAALVTCACYLADKALAEFAAALGLEGKGDIAGFPLLVLAAAAVSIALKPLTNALSRAHERRADRYALDATRNSVAFISAMKRLAASNLAEERPPRFVEVLFNTHPSAAARIEAAKSWAVGSRLSARAPNVERRVREPRAES
jgi:STE24 endopeptidase